MIQTIKEFLMCHAFVFTAAFWVVGAIQAYEFYRRRHRFDSLGAFIAKYQESLPYRIKQVFLLSIAWSIFAFVILKLWYFNRSLFFLGALAGLSTLVSLTAISGMLLIFLRSRVFGLALIEKEGTMRLWTKDFHDLPGARRAVWEARCMLGEPGVERVLAACVADGFFGKKWEFVRNPEPGQLDIRAACFVDSGTEETEPLAPSGCCPLGETLRRTHETGEEATDEEVLRDGGPNDCRDGSASRRGQSDWRGASVGASDREEAHRGKDQGTARGVQEG
ncbi:hypothetical protein [Thermosulfurimonas sp. F29]|uniref:hypothetical protein n=1 Tax=Thermosulfurimonas sp. F29 TaxID=2867247 RepID=UPI001C83E3E8|nr:hypothetical protein [Thermosulfurimonas sp. F29]MBX6423342.1 hypothetical protein [Thermosulfurimonas sp. F29]